MTKKERCDPEIRLPNCQKITPYSLYLNPLNTER